MRSPHLRMHIRYMGGVPARAQIHRTMPLGMVLLQNGVFSTTTLDSPHPNYNICGLRMNLRIRVPKDAGHLLGVQKGLCWPYSSPVLPYHIVQFSIHT